MNYIHHPDCNMVFGPPKGHDQASLPVDSLPICQREIEGVNCFSSYWRPDAAELAALVAGGSVRLNVLGNGHPVVSMEVVA